MLYAAVVIALASTSLANPSFIREFGQPDDVPPVDTSLDADWIEYKQSFNKTYIGGPEENYRQVYYRTPHQELLTYPL